MGAWQRHSMCAWQWAHALVAQLPAHLLARCAALQIIASDGVWDVLSADEAVAHVMDELSLGKSSQAAAHSLVEHVVKLGLESPLGEQDNTSAIVIAL